MKSTALLFVLSVSGFIYGSESSITVRGALKARSQDYPLVDSSSQSVESKSGPTQLHEVCPQEETGVVKPKKAVLKKHVKRSLFSKILFDKYNKADNHLRMSADSDTPERKETLSCSESTVRKEGAPEKTSEKLKKKLLMRLNRNSF